jgi:hypothetical protein
MARAAPDLELAMIRFDEGPFTVKVVSIPEPAKPRDPTAPEPPPRVAPREQTAQDLVEVFNGYQNFSCQGLRGTSLLFADPCVSFPIPNEAKPFYLFPQVLISNFASAKVADPSLANRIVLSSPTNPGNSRVSLIFRHSENLIRSYPVRFRFVKPRLPGSITCCKKHLAIRHGKV